MNFNFFLSKRMCVLQVKTKKNLMFLNLLREYDLFFFYGGKVVVGGRINKYHMVRCERKSI